MGQSVAMRLCVVFVEITESRTQVCMDAYGVMEVHNNVVFQANTADIDGGAVRQQQ